MVPKTQDVFLEFFQSVVNNNEVFGIVGKSQNLKTSLLTRLRNETGEEIEDPSFLLEKYTFFYFNLDSLSCCVLRNSDFRGFRRAFENFLRSSCNRSLKRIEVLPVLDGNFEDKIGKIRTISQLKMKFHENSPLSYSTLNLHEVFDLSNTQVRDVKISFKLNQSTISDTLRNLFKDKHRVDNNFHSLKIHAEDKDGQEEILDAVTRNLTKKVSIHLDDAHLRGLENITIILNTLRNTLSNSYLDFADNDTTL